MKYLVNLKSKTVHFLPVLDLCHINNWEEKTHFHIAYTTPPIPPYRICRHCKKGLPI